MPLRGLGRGGEGLPPPTSLRGFQRRAWAPESHGTGFKFCHCSFLVALPPAGDLTSLSLSLHICETAVTLLTPQY